MPSALIEKQPTIDTKNYGKKITYYIKGFEFKIMLYEEKKTDLIVENI